MFYTTLFPPATYTENCRKPTMGELVISESTISYYLVEYKSICPKYITLNREEISQNLNYGKICSHFSGLNILQLSIKKDNSVLRHRTHQTFW